MLSQVLDAARHFGADAVLIWAAVLLKKRIFVVSDQPAKLLAMIRVRLMRDGENLLASSSHRANLIQRYLLRQALPALVWHRRDWTVLRPLLSGARPWVALALSPVIRRGPAQGTWRTLACSLGKGVTWRGSGRSCGRARTFTTSSWTCPPAPSPPRPSLPRSWPAVSRRRRAAILRVTGVVESPAGARLVPASACRLPQPLANPVWRPEGACNQELPADGLTVNLLLDREGERERERTSAGLRVHISAPRRCLVLRQRHCRPRSI